MTIARSTKLKRLSGKHSRKKFGKKKKFSMGCKTRLLKPSASKSNRMAESLGQAVDKYCKNCYYYKKMHSESDRCCHYIFIEDKRRPCEPGAKCTVKIPINVYRRKKKNEAFA